MTQSKLPWTAWDTLSLVHSMAGIVCVGWATARKCEDTASCVPALNHTCGACAGAAMAHGRAQLWRMGRQRYSACADSFRTYEETVMAHMQAPPWRMCRQHERTCKHCLVHEQAWVCDEAAEAHGRARAHQRTQLWHMSKHRYAVSARTAMAHVHVHLRLMCMCMFVHGASQGKAVVHAQA